MAAIAEGASGSCPWHNRLGHMRDKGMKMLVAKGSLECLKSVDMGLCESSVMGKQKRVSFPKTPMDPKNVPLKWSIQMFGNHLQYHHLEDLDSMLPSLMILAGRLMRTVPGKARKNGIAKRMNKTLNERERRMRIHFGLPKTFWMDATAYVRVVPEKRDKLDAKAVKCYFIGYGSYLFGYRCKRVHLEPSGHQIENLHLEQMDVKTTLLHGYLYKEIYMQKPEGFVVPGKEHMVCKLTRRLYGLKSSMREINNLKTRLSAAFKMKDLCPVKQILGMKISRDRSAGTLNLSQELYIEKVLSKFIVNDAKPRTTPMANQLKWSKDKSPKTA
ncbi:uncharacterized protein [Solanum lycopersicum]|uniref:uncharacterized protein n=1 Tax=Solanum lycopersicum TaxID=4081 RepID=UPI00374A8E7D